MNIKHRLLLTTLAALTAAPMLCAALPNNSNPVTFVGPTLQGGYTGHIYHDSAYSVLGEVGPKNYRLNGTLAARVESDNYMKLSAEYLFQKITYGFITGNTDEWVQQMALGAAYEYDLHGTLDPRLNMGGYVSYSPSKPLSVATATIPFAGTTTIITENRRIAGSVAAGLSPGASADLWSGARGRVNLNYDNVRYDNSNTKKLRAIGLGGTVGLDQRITESVSLDASAAVRAPYNNYQLGLNWNDVPYMDNWTLGLDGSYVAGKSTLPNTWNVLLSANYTEAEVAASTTTRHYKDQVYKDAVVDDGHLLEYAADPAVYMPQVLAIVDNFVPACGTGVELTGVPLVNREVFVSPATIPSAASFHATGNGGLSYSIKTTGTLPAGSSVTINQSTGVITVITTGFYTVTYHVTASTPCGQRVVAGPGTITVGSF